MRCEIEGKRMNAALTDEVRTLDRRICLAFFRVTDEGQLAKMAIRDMRNPSVSNFCVQKLTLAVNNLYSFDYHCHRVTMSR